MSSRQVVGVSSQGFLSEIQFFSATFTLATGQLLNSHWIFLTADHIQSRNLNYRKRFLDCLQLIIWVLNVNWILELNVYISTGPFFTPLWHGAGGCFIPSSFWIVFCQLNFYQNFSNFFRDDINWIILTPCSVYWGLKSCPLEICLHGVKEEIFFKGHAKEGPIFDCWCI